MKKRIASWLLAAAFWTMFGWVAHDIVLQWTDGGDDDAPAIVQVLT